MALWQSAGPTSLSTEDEGIGGEDSDDEIVYCHKDDMELIGQRRKAKMERMNGNGRVSYKTFLVQMFNLPGLVTISISLFHVRFFQSMIINKIFFSIFTQSRFASVVLDDNLASPHMAHLTASLYLCSFWSKEWGKVRALEERRVSSKKPFEGFETDTMEFIEWTEEKNILSI